VERNRRTQQSRNQKRRLIRIANNTLAPDLTHSVAEVWLIGDPRSVIANNTLAHPKLLIVEPVSSLAGGA
jgi:hypothetical protein